MMQINGAKGTKLWKSSDGGIRWTDVFVFSGIRKNVDYSWVQTQMKWGYFFTQNGFYASQTNPNVAMLTTQGDFYITKDGGESWQSIINTPMGTIPGENVPRFKSIGLEMTTCFQYLIDPWQPEKHYIAFTDIGFIRSVDSGESWSYGAKGSPWPNTFYRIRFDPKVQGKMYAAAANRHDIPNWSQLAGWPKQWDKGGVVFSENYGATWTPMKNVPEFPCTDVLAYTDPKTDTLTLWAALYGKGIITSTDGGETWEDRTANLDPKNHNVIRLWRNTDNGNLYSLVTARREQKSGTFTMIAGGLWKSTDQGRSWSNLTKDLSITWPTAFVVDPDNENRILMAVASIPGKNPHYGGIWQTENGGTDWEYVLKDSTFRWSYDRMMAVALHPSDKSLVYAGGLSTGLWISQDRGKNWRNIMSFPFRSVQGIDFDPNNDSRMFLTTFGAGAWEGPHLPKE